MQDACAAPASSVCWRSRDRLGAGWGSEPKYGKEKLKDHNTPYDPDGYLNRLRFAISTIDPTIVTYITECLHAFRIGCLLSATITLGCAAEKAILLLVETYTDALLTGPKEKFRKATNGKMIRMQYAELNKAMENHLTPKLPSDVKDGLDTALTTVFNMFRSHRNDAGHPTGKALTREEVYALITAFPLYVKKAYELLDWIKSNAPLT